MQKLFLSFVVLAALVSNSFAANTASNKTTVAKASVAKKMVAQKPLPTIAILDFSTNKKSVQWYLDQKHHEQTDGSDDNKSSTFDSHSQQQWSKKTATEMSSALTSSFTNYMVASHKFYVVERKNLQQVLTEQDFIDSSEVSSDETNKLRRLYGADYLLTGTIEVMSTRMSREPVPYSHDRSPYYRGVLAVNIQILDTLSGQVVAAYPVQVTKEYRSHRDEIMNKTLFMNMLKDKLARVATNKIISTIFPMRIVDVQGNKLFINRGVSSDLHKGSLVTVYRMGKTMIDPDTGRILGVSKREIGQAKVIEINNKYSVVQVTRGNPKKMATGIIELANANPARPPREPTTPGSGAAPIQW